MSRPSRLGTLDAFRGLAVVGMIAVHAFDAWLTPAAREGALWYVVRTQGGYPATMFLFVAGLLLAVGTEARYAKGRPTGEVCREVLRRGAEVFGWAILFRLWMFAMSGFRDVASFGRVDVLNCMGVVLMAFALPLAAPNRAARLLGCALLAVLLAGLAPLAWDAVWPSRLPPQIGGYFSGRIRQAFFPLLPWGAFAAAGGAVGVWLAPRLARGEGTSALLRLGPVGVLLLAGSELAYRYAPSYGYDDYWRVAPGFTAWKLGGTLGLLSIFAIWDRLPGPSALRQLGRTSLLVYWVHIEIVYGAIVLPRLRRTLDAREAAIGYVLLVLAMLLLSLLRTRMSTPRQPLREPLPAA